MSEEIVVCFLRSDGRIHLRRQKGDGETGVWAVPSAETNGEADETARRLCRKLTRGDVTLVRTGDPVEVGSRIVHPYLFECESIDATGATDGVETAWIHATEIRHRETVDGLWRAYRAVSPSIESVREDRTHGSAYVSVRALEVVRDRAGEGAEWPALVECASELLAARPSMAAVANRLNRAMFEASEAANAVALEASTREGIDRAIRADERAAQNAAGYARGTVLTLSRSGTVEEALVDGDPERVIVLESRPDREGVDVAEVLADVVDVTLTLDAAVAHVVREVDALLVGADTVLADGSVVNKVGTRTAAIAAVRENVPLFAVAAADKISPSTEPVLEAVEREAITENEAVGVDCPLFDRTPPELVAGVITEDGVLDGTEIGKRAAGHDRRSRWKETNPSEG